METKENVKKFYDDYIPRQKKYGVTPRHHFILKRLKQYGLNSNSKVLEIGCGIGTLSSIIIKEVNNGFFLGCDISEESIKVCKRDGKGSIVYYFWLRRGEGHNKETVNGIAC